MWNLKIKQKLTHGYREEYGGWGEYMKGIKRYKLTAIKQITGIQSTAE